MSATLYDFRDLDLMLKIGAEDGGVLTTADFTETLGLDDRRGVGSRLAWMRRYGMVKRNGQGVWSLTSAGERVVGARLLSQDKHALESISDEAMIEVMAHVTSRYQHGQAVVAHMLRREFMFGTRRR